MQPNIHAPERQNSSKQQESKPAVSPVCVVRTTPMRPCLKVATLPESLHSSYYGKNTTAESKSIRFDTIERREYARTVGDNPPCSSGPPLAIDWIYDEPLIIPVKEFEENRPPRRTYSQLIVGGTERQEMLLKEWNIPE
jgi:hypothetical protein